MSSNLPPQATPFIGRDDDLRRLDTLLTNPDCRLITVLGAGGVGKTRLALAAAGRQIGHYASAVYFVPLLTVSQPEQLAFAIAAAAGFTFYGDNAATQLHAYLRDKRLLLVLDNMEHLLDGADFITELLAAAPDVKLLVTSRERLNLRSETVFGVEGLPVTDWTSVEEARAADAARLFLQSARHADADFDLSPANLPAVTRICRLAEGMPLAIELAAAWVDVLSPAEIAEEVERCAAFLTVDLRDLPPRHRSMWAVFESSWNRLNPDEQARLCRMAVFRGGFTRRAAESVAGANVRTLQTLVNKSLLTYSSDGRYELHELLRQFLEDRLEERGETAATEAAHRHYMLAWLAGCEANVKGGAQRRTLDEIERDFQNVRAAWQSALDNGDAVLDGAVESVFWACMMRNRYREGEALFAAAEARMTGRIWARATLRRLWMRRWREGTFAPHPETLHEINLCLDTLHREDDQQEQAVGLLVLASARGELEDNPDGAATTLAESLRVFESVGDDFYAAWVLHLMGRLACASEGLSRAVELQERSLTLRERIGDLNGVIYARHNLSVYWLQLSNLARSEAEAQAMRDLSREMNERSGLLMSASTLCLIALVRGDTDTALHLSQEILPVAADLRHTLGRQVALVVQATVAALNGETAQALGLLRAVGDASHDLVSYFVGWAAALALSAAGDTDGTGAHLRESLGYALDVQGAGVVAWCLPPAALLAARDGDEAQVLSLTTLIEATELCPWAALWQPYARLRESLTVQPEKAVSLAALMAAGGMLRASLSSAHEENGRFPAHVQAANAALHEPLSERELEVLSLIAGGLQNQEIADQLVVGVSTVKKHISHIYGKLGVTTRTQALLRARELGLG